MFICFSFWASGCQPLAVFLFSLRGMEVLCLKRGTGIIQYEVAHQNVTIDSVLLELLSIIQYLITERSYCKQFGEFRNLSLSFEHRKHIIIRAIANESRYTHILNISSILCSFIVFLILKFLLFFYRCHQRCYGIKCYESCDFKAVSLKKLFQH